MIFLQSDQKIQRIMGTQNTLDSIPTDLLHEIFSRLPVKTVGRCCCVSKILALKLGNEDFKKLFLTRSLTRPRLLFVRLTKEWVFYSSLQPQTPYDESSIVVEDDFVSKFPRSRRQDFSYASGLFYFPGISTSTVKGEEEKTWRVICNPSTGRYVILPKLEADIWLTRGFLGFDPIDKQFKLLVINGHVDNERINFILTLGTGKMRWRTIKCPFLRDYPFIAGICINGVLYYLAKDSSGRSYVIVCFDVRTETFKFKPIVIDHNCSPRLINHKGKLGITILRGLRNTAELYMLVIEEDVEKQKWLKYTLPSKMGSASSLFVVGMTSTDEIVLWSETWRLFNVYYFNPGRNSFKSVEVKGFENNSTVHVFMDHVEDLYLNDAKYFKSNIDANLLQGRFVLSDEEDDDQVS